MGLFSWLYKVGAPGQTARTVVSQYLKVKEKKPGLEDREIMEMIIAARHASISYKPHQLEQLKKLLDKRPSLFDFVVELIEIDTNVYSDTNVLDPSDVETVLKIKNGIEEAVKEAFQKYGIELEES